MKLSTSHRVVVNRAVGIELKYHSLPQFCVAQGAFCNAPSGYETAPRSLKLREGKQWKNSSSDIESPLRQTCSESLFVVTKLFSLFILVSDGYWLLIVQHQKRLRVFVRSAVAVTRSTFLPSVSPR